MINVRRSISLLGFVAVAITLVGTPLGCLPEIVGDGPASLLYEPGGLSAALVRAQQLDALREDDALARVAARDWTHVAKLTAACYRSEPSSARL